MNWLDKWRQQYTISSDAGEHPSGPPGPPGPEIAAHAPPPPPAPSPSPRPSAVDWDDLTTANRIRTRAVYPSDCHGCGERIQEGDDIFRADDGDWVCSEECADG